MNKLEHLLRIPAPVITLIWLGGFWPNPRPRFLSGPGWNISVAPAYSPSLIFAVVMMLWIYALYEASIARVAPASLRYGRRVFALTAMSYVAVAALAHAAYFWPGTPPDALLVAFGLAIFPAAACSFVVIFSAAHALSEFEASVTPPGVERPWSPLLPIFVLGIGIWFLKKRVDRMLEYPRLAEDPSLRS